MIYYVKSENLITSQNRLNSIKSTKPLHIVIIIQNFDYM